MTETFVWIDTHPGVILTVTLALGLALGAHVVRRAQRRQAARDAELITALRALGNDEWDALMAATEGHALDEPLSEYQAAALWAEFEGRTS